MVAVNGNLYGFSLNGINRNERAIRQGTDPIGFESSFAGDAYPLRAKRETRPRPPWNSENGKRKREADFDSEINMNGMSLNRSPGGRHGGKRSADFENELHMEGMSLNRPPKDDKPRPVKRDVSECITSDNGLCG